MIDVKNKIAITFSLMILLVGINFIDSASAVSEIVIGDYKNYDSYNEGIYNAKIDGNILKLDVIYGGCKDKKQDFKLIWSGNYLKSNPPQVTLVLILDNSTVGTDCMRLWENTLEFDLKKIRLSKGSFIHLHDSVTSNAPRYRLVYEGEEGFNNIDVCPADLKTCPDGTNVGRELPNCDFPICPSFEGCENIGLRNDGKYCSFYKVLLEQKAPEERCDNNFECNSNVCVNDKCVRGSLIQKIIDWFKRLFG